MARHILLVDDDPVFLDAMAQSLRLSRYRVSTAEHFSAALDLLESSDKPQALVVDVMMPRSINGVAMGRMARLRHPSIAIIFITGHVLPELDEFAFGPVLRKPVEPSQLIAAIEVEIARRAGETYPAAPSSSATSPSW